MIANLPSNRMGDFKMRAFAGGLAALALVMSASSAYAVDINGLGDPADAVTGTQIDFEGEALGSYTVLTIGDVTITGAALADLRVDSSFAGQYNSTGAKYLDNNAGQTHSFIFDFANAVSAIAFNWGAADIDWGLTAYDSGNNIVLSRTLAPTFDSNAQQYYGFSSGSSNISRVTIETSSTSFQDWVFVDRFTYGDTAGAVVPEPATWALLIGGFAMSGVALRSRRRSILA